MLENRFPLHQRLCVPRERRLRASSAMRYIVDGIKKKPHPEERFAGLQGALSEKDRSGRFSGAGSLLRHAV